jgi:hypothetical protein
MAEEGTGDYEQARAKFLKIFANMPEKIRSEDVAAVVDDKPYTWANAAIEVKGNTDTGKKILKSLQKLSIL